MEQEPQNILSIALWRKLLWGVAVLALLFALWPVVVCFVVAGLLTLLGRPVTQLLARIKVKGRRLPASLTALIATIVVLGVGLFLAGVVVIPILSQLVELVRQGPETLQLQFSDVARQAELQLGLWGVNQSTVKWMLDIMHAALETGIAAFDSRLVSNLLSTMSNGIAYMGIIGFSTFMLLAEPCLGSLILIALTPTPYRSRMIVAIRGVRQVLYRYIMGIFVQTSIFSLIVFLILFFTGVPQSGTIAILGGISNLIPYVGPVFGSIAGILIAVLALPHSIHLDAAALTIGIVALSFLVAQLIDNNLAQPLIFSNVLEAHPFLIFGLVIIGAQLAGGVGMIAALPTFAAFRAWAVVFYPTAEWVSWLYPKGHPHLQVSSQG